MEMCRCYILLLFVRLGRYAIWWRDGFVVLALSVSLHCFSGMVTTSGCKLGWAFPGSIIFLFYSYRCYCCYCYRFI